MSLNLWQRILYAIRKEPYPVEMPDPEPLEERLGKYKVTTRTAVTADVEGVLNYGVGVMVELWVDRPDEPWRSGYCYLDALHRDVTKAEVHDTIRQLNAAADNFIADREIYNTSKVRYVE